MNDDYREPSLWKIALDINTYRDPLYWQTVKEDWASGGATSRVVATIHAYVGIFAGAGQMIYGAAKPSTLGGAVAVHGFGNYFGSIGNLSNTIYGTGYDWNFTRKGYEKTSERLLSDAKYGTNAFYAADILLSIAIAAKSTRVSDTVGTTSKIGITLERHRKIPLIMSQPLPVIINDTYSLLLSGIAIWED